MKQMSELSTKAWEVVKAAALNATVERNCTECGNPFRVPSTTGQAQFSFLCETCKPAAIEAEKQRRDRARAAAINEGWFGFCPQAFQECDRAKLPLPAKLDEVLAWAYSPRGLVLHGESGTGKTRCAWALMKREHYAGRRCAVMDSIAGLSYAALYAKGADVVEVWIKNHIAVDLLLLDDIFKVKLTDSFEGLIFTLVDQRIANCRPTILTSNDTGATLAARMSQDRGNPLLRRLREHCQQIHF